MHRRQLHAVTPAGGLCVRPVVLLVAVRQETGGVVVTAGAVGADGCPLVGAGRAGGCALVFAGRTGGGCLFPDGSCHNTGRSVWL